MSLSSLYGTSGSAGFAGPTSTYSAPSAPAAPSEPSQAGKFNFDFTDPVRSTFEGIANVGDFIGKIGVGDFNIGNVLGGVGSAVGAIGNLGVDFASTGPVTGLHLRDIPGAAGNILGGVVSAISIPEQWLEENAARGRIQQFQRSAPSYLYENLSPTDARRVAAGEDINALAKEMAQSGRGWSQNTTLNLALSIVADPLNLVTLGIGKIASGPAQVVKTARAAQEAGQTEAAAAELAKLAPISRVAGYAYNAATSGATAGVKALVQGAVGPATSGIVRAYGPQRWVSFLNAVGKESDPLRQTVEKYLGVANTQMLRAVIGKVALKQYDPILKEATSATEITARIADLAEKLPKSPFIAKIIDEDAAQLARKTAPRYLSMTEEARRADSIARLAVVGDIPEEQAARILGKADLQTSQIVDQAFYGRAGTDLATARDALVAKNVPAAERVTLLSESALTKERAAAILAGTPQDLIDGVARYDVLEQRFGGVAYGHKDVLDYIRRLVNEDFLPEEIGKAIPKGLKDWRAKYEKFGYSLGYAPKSGWKPMLLGDGEIAAGDPFIHFQPLVTPALYRNPIGRFGDALFGIIHQRQLILSSEHRMQDIVTKEKLGIAPAQSDAIHRTILREAANNRKPPRALITVAAHEPEKYGNRIQEIFAEHLSDAQYKTLIERSSPEFVFFRAIRGNLSEVGLTQAISGGLKAAGIKPTRFGGAPGRWLTKISESFYPLAKFEANPYFQLQELVETPFWKTLRGIQRDDMIPEVRQAVLDLFASDPNFRFIAEDYGNMYLLGNAKAADRVVQKGLRGALGRIGGAVNIAGAKREAAIDQILFEYGEHFRDAVRSMDPKLWIGMEEAAGSTDARVVAREFVRERQNMAKSLKGLSDELGRVKSDVMPYEEAQLQALYDAGKIDEAQAMQRKLGIERGGSAESGGAVKASAFKPNADEETLWQAWVYSLRKASETARTTQYFREGRGFLERTLNHPFLGLYPLSYASKAYMEFARFLLVRPFGLNAPLLGLDALNKFQHAVIVTMEDKDSGIEQFISDHPKALNFINQMLPYWPTQIGASTPLWARTLEQKKNAGIGDVPLAVSDQLGFTANPLRFTDELGNIIKEAQKANTANLGSARTRLTIP